MEISGDLFKPFLGLVRQSTNVVSAVGAFTPVGRLIPWKMSKTTLDAVAGEYDVDNNALPGFSSAIATKRKATGTIHQASFDPAFSINGLHANVAAAAAFQVREGMYIRAGFEAFHSVAGPHPLAPEVLGVPIIGAAGELPVVGAGIGTAPALAVTSYIFLALLITKVHHEAEAAAGQPFDFDFRTVHAYAIPGESRAQLTAYGYSNTIGPGGFL